MTVARNNDFNAAWFRWCFHEFVYAEPQCNTLKNLHAALSAQ